MSEHVTCRGGPRIGGPLADFYVRGAGALGLAGIAIALLAPGAADLVVFVALAVWFNGPQSPIVPAGFETVLLLYGQIYPPFLLALLGTAGAVLVETVNYRLFAVAAATVAIRRVGGTRVARWLVRMFRKAPFLTIAINAAVLPLWLGRTLVVLAEYPLPRHLAATAVGRLPRFWVLATAGSLLEIPVRWLAAAVGLILLGTAGALVLRRRREPGHAGHAAAARATGQK